MIEGFKAAALRLVPSDWRDAVEQDLDHERPYRAGALWFAARAASIGTRLRMARAIDARRQRRHTSASRIRRSSPMHDFGRDLRLAVRTALRHPGYALAVIATLAIGIGANTAIFSLFNWILFRPLPGVLQPEELVTIKYQTAKRDSGSFVSYRDYADLRDNVTRSLTGLAGAVAERRKEFGIRLALGARAGSVLRLVIRSAALLSAIGLVLGLTGAAALRRLVASRLFGVSGLDPLTIAGTVVVIVVLTLVASLVPAMRAARVDPVRSLRVDA